MKPALKPGKDKLKALRKPVEVAKALTEKTRTPPTDAKHAYHAAPVRWLHKSSGYAKKENMQLGINQNITYNGGKYHIQTEDGGKNNPVITTLVFREGTILASKRTDYADILKYDKLDMLVKEMMEEQHATLLRALKRGRFDKVREPIEESGKAGEKTEEPERQGADSQGPVEEKEGPPLDEKSLNDIILERLSLDK